MTVHIDTRGGREPLSADAAALLASAHAPGNRVPVVIDADHDRFADAAPQAQARELLTRAGLSAIHMNLADSITIRRPGRAPLVIDRATLAA